ncbi:hypothetical protein ACLMJK_004498 [Lecanora helva]
MLGFHSSPFNRHQASASNPVKPTPSSASESPSKNGMAKASAVANGDYHYANGDKSPLTTLDRSLDTPLEVRKGSVMTNDDHTYRESYSKSRTTRRSETQTHTKDSSSEIAFSFSNEQQITVLHETVVSAWGKFVAEFDQVDEQYIKMMTIDGFLEYIERQRLTYMPHRGDRWDKVLKWAEYFGLQISEYAKAIDAFVPDSQTAAKLIWAASCTLLELGPENAKALETTFGVFYELGLTLSLLLRQNKLLYANRHIRMEVGKAYNGILILVRDVSTVYHAKLTGMMSHEANIDFTSLFRTQIQGFTSRKNHIVDSMWREKLGDQDSMDIATLRSWLNPRDRMLDRLHEDRTLTPEQRDEYTCEWFQRHLLDFSRSGNDVLALVGPKGSGKTYLARWIIERLQRPLSKKIYETLFFRTEVDIRGTTTSLALAKSLSLQLLEKNVGDQSLFDALVKAYDLSATKNVTASSLENALWDALDTGLNRFTGRGNNNLMIVVEGIHDLKSEDSVESVIDQLSRLTSKHTRLQAITLSQIPHKPKNGKTQLFQLKPDHTHEDLRHVAEHNLQTCVHYRDQSDHQQEAVVERLIHTAQGNFLWLLLTISLLKKESSYEAFEKAVKALRDAPKSLDQTIRRVFETSVDLNRSDAHLILSWMLVAKRPLSIMEIQNLLEIDLPGCQIAERRIDLRSDIHLTLGPLVVFHNDFVRFRHDVIRDQLLDIQSHGKTKLLSQRDAQKDLTMRLLGYCRLTLTHDHEPSLDTIGKGVLDDVFNRHAVLEYAVCNWTRHFRSSSLHSGNSFQLSAEFKRIFPASTLMVLLEWASWSPQLASNDTYELALRIREAIFTEKHECVLQSLVACGTYFRTTAKTTEAGLCFYRASHIAQTVLRKTHTLTVTCATTFLSITESTTSNVRTELVSQKEETLKYVIEAYKHQHGQAHDLVIRYYKMLAQLYVEVHEESKAESTWRELREIVVHRFGKGSEEETSISEQLVIVLKKGEKKTDIVEYEKGIFDITTELEVWDIRRIEFTFKLALSYEARGELFMAEELYITLWRRLTERCHHAHQHHGIEIHIYMIDVALEYVRFLRRCQRHEEACNILICVWTEYEDYDFESETLFLRLKIIGELMRAVSLFSVAMTVFKKCWNWFKLRSKTEYMMSCETLISETVQEIITTTATVSTVSSSTTTSTTTSSSSEIVVKEVFESTLSRKEVTSETISVCKSLISYYMRLEQWSAAIEVTRRSLSVVWKFVLSGAGTVALPHSFGSGAIDIAISLAICHYRSHHYHEAEEIYVRVFRACRSSCHIEDGRFVKSFEVLLKFYEDHHHWHKMIEIYQDLLVEYRKTLGATHKLTIRTLYILGSLCADHGHGVARDYYVEIIEVLNRGSTICHIDALDAMFVVCRIYYEAAHWHKLKNVCEILWETWREQGHGHHKFTAEIVELLYIRYRYVLEHHEVCEYSVLRQLTVEYRNVCIKVFGAAASITVKASIELAEVCMRSESHMHEAISIYEEILTTIKTTTTTTTTATTTSVVSSSTISKIKHSLTRAYVSNCAHASVSTTIVERAITVTHERYEFLKVKLGFAHSETLTCLRELVVLHMKLTKHDKHSIVSRILMKTCIEIILAVTESKVLHEAAKAIAGIYVNHGLSEQGRALMEELRVQIITGTAVDKSSFKLDKTVGKTSYVFLVTFEQIIKGQFVSYSEIMAELLTETYLYESYHRCIKSQSEITVVLIQASRLRGFLESHGRRTQKEFVEKQSFEIFAKKWEFVLKGRDEISFTFYLGLLGELEKEAREVSIGNAACAASIAIVKELLSCGKYQRAYDVATCALRFVNHHRAFHLLQNVPYGFKLSALVAGRELNKPLPMDLDPQLREGMLKLSREIIREVLSACKASKIDFTRLQLKELNSLTGLLGEQQNYADLEWLLDLLWSSREVQKKWKPENIVAIGRRFVQARYLIKDRRSRAIRLCEDISYNLRRVWGSLDFKALEVSELLSQLYTSMGHYRESQGVHENILRLVVDGDDGDDRTPDKLSPRTARNHLDLLKQSYLRLQGWDKSAAMYKSLVQSLITMYKGEPEWKDVKGVETWDCNKEKPSETLGKFAPPAKWEFAQPADLDEQHNASKSGRRPGMGLRASSSYWGIGEVHRVLHGYPERIYSQNGGVTGADKQQIIAKTVALDDDEDGYESATEEPKVNGVKA